MWSRVWIAFACVVFVCAMLATRVYEVDLPLWHYFAAKRGSIDPLTLHQQGEFVEGNLGVSQEPPGPLTVRIIAQQYLFVPACMEVPAGVPVRFRVTSADVVHSLAIAGTGFQMKTVPGAVSESTYTFDKPGEHAMPCNEFCGAGHYAMRARVVVVPPEKWTKLKPGERRSCAPR